MSVLGLGCMTSHPSSPSPRPRRTKTFASDQTASLFKDEELRQAPAAKVPSNDGTKASPQPPASGNLGPTPTAKSPYARHKQCLANRNRRRFGFEGPRSVWESVDARAKAKGESFGDTAIDLLELALEIVARRLRRQKRPKP